MSHRTIVIILALLVALMPFLGFPYGFEKYFYLGAGLVIASLAYRSSVFRSTEARLSQQAPDSQQTYEQEGPFGSNDHARQQ